MKKEGHQHHELDFDPVVCIPEEERTKGQKQKDWFANNMFHTLSKLQEQCAIYQIQQLEKGIEDANNSVDEAEEIIDEIKR